MKSIDPPPFATWLLRRLARDSEALTGDLWEEYRRGRSGAWYWRQTLMAIMVGRSREILLTVGVLALFRLGNLVPVPGTNAAALAVLGRQSASTTFRLYDVGTGGNLLPVTVLALGLHPYISASVVVQLLALAWQSLSGRADRPVRAIVHYTWLTAMLLAAVQALGLALFLERQSAAREGLQLVYHPGWTFRLTVVLAMTAGTAGLMWLSDRITMRGMWNGMLLVSLAGLAVGLSGVLALAQVTPAFLMRMLGAVSVVAVTAHWYRRAMLDPLGCLP